MKVIALSSDDFNKGDIQKELRDVIKPGMKVVCIPFASDIEWLCEDKDEDLGYDGNFTKDRFKPFYDYGIDRDDFYVVRVHDNIEFMKWKIKQSDIIYFSGGFMENLLEVLQLTKLDEFILDNSKNKIFIGVSAGALAMCDKYYTYPCPDHQYRFEICDGLGLLPGVRIVVHYNEKDVPEEVMRQLDELQMDELINGDYDLVLVTLEDGEGILYTPETHEYKWI